MLPNYFNPIRDSVSVLGRWRSDGPGSGGCPIRPSKILSNRPPSPLLYPWSATTLIGLRKINISSWFWPCGAYVDPGHNPPTPTYIQEVGYFRYFAITQYLRLNFKIFNRNALNLNLQIMRAKIVYYRATCQSHSSI